MKFKNLILFFTINSFLLTGCSFLSPKTPTLKPQIQEPAEFNVAMQSGVSGALFEISRRAQLKKSSEISNLMSRYLNKKDGADCSGFVSLINKKSENTYFKERNLDKFYSKRGLKSEAIFNLYQSQNLITESKPKVGDLVFFNNTTDKTKNYKKTKVITHVGIVDKIYEDGTIRFMHHSGKKSKYGFMNFTHKNRHKSKDKVLNSYVVNCKKKTSSCLASNRFAGFGSVKF